MITPDLNKDGFTGHILIEPNRPVSWADNVRFVAVFSLVSFVIGLVFLFQGLALVMPFSGLEILVVFLVLYLVFKKYSSCQVIYFTKDCVIIETGKVCAETHVEYPRYWSKFLVADDGNCNIPRLSICAKGVSTDIGDFLNYDDKTQLIELIKHITVNFQLQSRVMPDTPY